MPLCHYLRPRLGGGFEEQKIKMARRTRLSEAHQFFEGQDMETLNADTDTTSERVCIMHGATDCCAIRPNKKHFLTTRVIICHCHT